jgi:hypothetical protein
MRQVALEQAAARYRASSVAGRDRLNGLVIVVYAKGLLTCLAASKLFFSAEPVFFWASNWRSPLTPQLVSKTCDFLMAVRLGDHVLNRIQRRRRLGYST